MSSAADSALPTYDGTTLLSSFAREFPELAIPWEAAAAPQPAPLLINEVLAAELGLDAATLREGTGTEFLVGRALAHGSRPVAQQYAGHQFGAYSPVLGDGRALLLGELTTPEGELRDLHLKGSGPTPTARGDGFAAVGPMVREAIVSEAMHALGIPTTRALAVTLTGRTVVREDFLRDDALPGAVLARVAASHLRVGTFQYARAKHGPDLVRRLTRYALDRHDPEPREQSDENTGGDAIRLLTSVTKAQAALVAQWMLVGFVHGVMNTDNVTISGETIDYGPCAFLDAYDPAAVFSSIDHGGRYAYGAQPQIAKWNLARFAEALLPTIDEDQERAVAAATAAINEFDRAYNDAWGDGLRRKLGVPRATEDEIRAMATGLFADLQARRADFTGAFRALTAAVEGNGDALAQMLPEPGPWAEQWRRLDPDAGVMREANPVYIPRNHLVEEAVDAATDGDTAPLQRLMDALEHPFTERPGLQRYAEPAPADSGRFVTYCGT